MTVISTEVEAAADYYTILGVDPGAEGADIRLAYRKLMRLYHPDVNRTDEAARKATAINEAYACLGDPDERAAYDHQRRARHSRPVFTTPPSGDDHGYPPHRPSWQPHHAYMAEIHAEPPPTRWKVVSLGLAAVLTVITFKITAEVTGVVMAPPPPMVFVQTAPSPPAEAAPAEPRCKRPSDADSGCTAPKAAPSR
ncbi:MULTISPECIES: J domain-containing protein [Sphingomonas]|uniref:J domain-containing protein n=1 Tax=Sphingomonas TaxID=13687 RepID=UPI000DEF43C7|nr:MULTISPECIES: J domain-containing protein [Sphingomonas]